MMKIRAVTDLISRLTGRVLGAEEYVTFGNVQTEITGIMVAWCASGEAVEAALKNGCNVLIHHESLLQPYPLGLSCNDERQYLSWQVNRDKIALLDRAGLLTLRIHGSADELTVFDVFAEQLKMGKVLEHGAWYAEKIYESPVSCAGDLAELVKKCCGMSAIRMSGDNDTPVSRVGLAWGGMGLFVNVGHMQKLVELGADVIVAGECDNLSFRFAADQNIPLIETSHEVSENAGLEAFASLLRENLPLPVHFYREAQIWRMI